MKDMPAEIPDGLHIGAIPRRENAADVLIARNASRFGDLRQGAVIGTSSLRRAAQLRHSRPDIDIAPLRGNLDTRLKKLESDDLDAIVLAAAGIKRLKLEHRITEYLEPDIMLPAVGQGALCIETRQNDSMIASLMQSLNDASTRSIVLGERAFLNRLGGSCQVPIAGHGQIDDGQFKLTGLVAELDGSHIYKAVLTGALDAAESVGIRLAEDLMSRGADRVLEKLQSTESGNEKG
jgi:hydroxymethylbilane synthase